MGAGSEKPVVRMSVRAVVETTLHESDLSPAAGAAKRMREGAAAHRARQRGEGARDEAYRAEVALAADYAGEHVTLRVTGRADGITLRADGVSVIEEIKLGAPGMPLVPAHMAQAAMYGHMLCEKEGMGGVCLRILYVDAQGGRLQTYEEERSAASLEEAFCRLCEAAAAWEERKFLRRQARDRSLAGMGFPFGHYRPGQRRFAQNVYVAIRERRRLFAQAPTGIGKTMAALYPALLAIRDGHCARAVFLTARVTGRRSAVDALVRLHDAGAALLAAEIAAKDKVCPQGIRDCRPEVCPCAEGFYDRLPQALEEALCTGGVYDRAAIGALAQRYGLCPFELSLELARLSDVAVCDYNYVYDPFVAIDALLQAPGGACLLVDEAHQLGSRVRDALSGQVSLAQLREIRREAGKTHGRKAPLYKALTGAIAAMKELAQQPQFAAGEIEAPPEALCAAMEQALGAASAQLAAGASAAAAAEAFRMTSAFCFAAGRFDSRYAALSDGDEHHASLLLQCLDASPEILAASKRARGAVYFSATVAPFAAAQRTLGSEEGDACLALPSPFDPAKLAARIEPIDIRYAAREKTAPQVAAAIAGHLQAHPGNTLVFFPSYAYMERLYELVLGEPGLTGIRFEREARALTEDEKNALLGAFEDMAEPIALFAVLGGGFSEGIDLPGERLKNVIIVSTGLPQPDSRVRAMQRYYDAQSGDGFFMAMTLPGMIRVIQAAGRVIRTDEDTGSLLLIDSRYLHRSARALLAHTLAGDALGIQG